MAEYKPNIYPIMYWAILYGMVATLVLFVIYLLASYVSVLWFPVFLAGLIWGGFRRYKKDKESWVKGQGIVGTSKSPLNELKDAARDIAAASQEMIVRNRKEDATTAAQAAAQQQEVPQQSDTPEPEQSPNLMQPPQAPLV